MERLRRLFLLRYELIAYLYLQMVHTSAHTGFLSKKTLRARRGIEQRFSGILEACPAPENAAR